MKRRIAAVAALFFAFTVGGPMISDAGANSDSPCQLFVFDAPGGAGTDPEILVAQQKCGDGDLYDQLVALAAAYRDKCRTYQFDAVTQKSAKEAGGPNEWGRWMSLKIGEVATANLAGAITTYEVKPGENCGTTTTTTAPPPTSSSTTAPTTQPVPTTQVPPPTSPPTTATTAPTDISVFHPTTTVGSPAEPLAATSVTDPSQGDSLPTTGHSNGVLVEVGGALVIVGAAMLLIRRRFAV